MKGSKKADQSQRVRARATGKEEALLERKESLLAKIFKARNIIYSNYTLWFSTKTHK